MTKRGLYLIQIQAGPGAVHGEELTGLVLAPTYEFVPEHSTLADVVAHEVSGDGYGRLTATGRVAEEGRRIVLYLDDVTGTDLSDVEDRAGIVWVRPDDTLVKWVDDPGGPVDPYGPSWPTGLYDIPIDAIDEILDDHDDRITKLENSPLGDTPPDTVQSVAGIGPDGDGDIDATALAAALGVGEGGGSPLGTILAVAVEGTSSPVFVNVGGLLDDDENPAFTASVDRIELTAPPEEDHPGDVTIVLTGWPEGRHRPVDVVLPCDGSRWYQLQAGDKDMRSTGATGPISMRLSWGDDGSGEGFAPWAERSTGAGTVPYKPGDAGDWTEGAPETVGDGLDKLAARTGGGGVTEDDVDDAIAAHAAATDPHGTRTQVPKMPSGRYSFGVPEEPSMANSLAFLADSIMAWWMEVELRALTDMGVYVTSTIASATLRIGLYLPDGTDGLPGTLAYAHSGTLNCATPGWKNFTPSYTPTVVGLWGVAQTGGANSMTTRSPQVSTRKTLGGGSTSDLNHACNLRAGRSDAALPSSLSGTSWSYFSEVPHGIQVAY